MGCSGSSENGKGVKKQNNSNPKTRGKGAGVGSGPENTNPSFKMEGRMDVEGRIDNPDFAPDVEVELGFPDKKTSYSTKPCLEDVNDEYPKADKTRALKKKFKNGLQDMWGGDRDFNDAMAAS
mmetsp:Transcript_4432/g.5090  ORF Transcript_4432/g.5090 Transcript_4432/m.5090 type:complete len:123 (+) Transcript_4432:10-378(+)